MLAFDDDDQLECPTSICAPSDPVAIGGSLVPDYVDSIPEHFHDIVPADSVRR